MREARHTHTQTHIRDSKHGGVTTIMAVVVGTILRRQVKIPGISGNFNGAGARTPPGEREVLNEWLDMVMGAHWANKVGPPRVMTGFARDPALIAFYLFLISRTPHTDAYGTDERTDRQTRGRTHRAGGHIRAEGPTASAPGRGPLSRFISLIGARDRLTADPRDSARFTSRSFVRIASPVAFFIARESIAVAPSRLIDSADR